MPRSWCSIVAMACLFLGTTPLSALNPAYRISQYLHTAWKGDSGLQAVRRLAQTPDGYLWLATRGGLVRFDGSRFTTFLAGSVPGLESSTTQDLLVDPDGSLWIATLGGGISHYQEGTFRSYTIHDGLPSDEIQTLYRDTRGVLWVGTRDGKIARLVRGRFEKVSLGIPDGSVITGFAETADQSLWIATFGNGVFRLRGGDLTAFSAQDGIPDARVAGLYRGRSGKIWTAGWKGVSSWDGTRFVPYASVNKSVDYAIGIREDRDGNLWISASSGLFRAQRDSVVKLDRNSGLSADFASDVFEDRDGNLWVATRAGLDRLRDGPLRTFAAKEGLYGAAGPIVVEDSGAIWTMSEGIADRIADSELSTWPVALPSRAQTVTLLKNRGSEFLIGVANGVVRWQPRSAARTIPTLAGLDVRCLLKARDGTIWIGTENRGLLHWKSSPDFESSYSLETIVPKKSIRTLAEDHSGAIWAGSSFGGGLDRVTGEQVQHYGKSQGLKSDHIYTVFIDGKGDLWIGSEAGLSWFQNGTIRTVSSRQGLPSDQIFAIVDDSYDRLWFATFAGIVSLEKKSLTDWAEGRRDRLNPTVYGATDEMRIYFAGSTFPIAARSGDGHLWFSFALGVSEVVPPDPRISRENQFPIMVEDVRIDGTPHPREDRLRIPPGARSIEIAYTAIALANPESVRFRYRLQGLDKNWINADSRRIAFYDNLKPGTYKFTVSASAGAGQWREAPALVLEQLPFFYQTTWFMLLTSTIVVSLGVLAYRLRLGQVSNRIRASFQERMDERTRIARELHDTLLQSFQASLIQMQTARNIFSRRPEKVIQTLDDAIGSAEQAIDEGRRTIQDLRTTVAPQSNLEYLLTAAAQELAEAPESNGTHPAFGVTVEGARQALSPILHDEIYRIGRELLRNAFHHAQASHIDAEIRYGNGNLRLRIRDDGKGIDRNILDEGARPGHWGLPGVRERTKRIGGRFDIWSEAGEGTEIELTVPASSAYEKSQAQRRFALFSRKKSDVV
jgi:signal transduction histidine kinase/ligand-binding sensor domain-containing protein